MPPNLVDYQKTYRDFSWTQARAALSGLPGDAGLNIAHEAVDRYAQGRLCGKIALRFLDKEGAIEDFSYDRLAQDTNRFASALSALGVTAGDRVFALLGRVPALYIAALGTLKHKSVFCPLFSAFGPEPIKTRLERGDARVLVTTDALYRKKVHDLRRDLPGLEHVLLVDGDTSNNDVSPGTRRFAGVMQAADREFAVPQTSPEDTALLHFTSGTTGTPKGAVHVHGAVVAHYMTGRLALDLHDDDVFWCTADPGWVTGMSYGIIAPLCCGVTTIVDEAEFDAERWYRVLAEQRVTVWYTAPTAIRMLMRVGGELASNFDLTALRFAASVGEPLNPEAVVWGEENLGLPFHDNWWQTETGGIMIAEHIRIRLTHPVVDSDGHTIEYLPVVREFLAEIGGPELADRFFNIYGPMTLWRSAPPEMRKAFVRPAWWGLPARNTLDRATAMLPRLLHQRLAELGIDFSVLYPTYGLHVLGVADEELRRAAARAFNRYHAELYREYSDRMATVALIPMHTPEEALAELDHAVGELGFKAVVMPGHVFRSMQNGARWFGRRMDCFAIDSEHDYDPVWRRCSELKISPTFHSNGMGWGSHASTSNYMFNHLGSFAAANEAICRALLFGGVPRRFPELRFGFLEGGVSWACSLYFDLIEHFEKRNRAALERYNPRNMDQALLRQLFESHAPARIRAALGELDQALRILSDPDEEPVDEFAGMGVTSPEELGEIFRTSLHFGCEPDDRMSAHAFNERVNPGGVRLRAIFSSDLGHWDIPDMQEVVHEAYELVEEGIMSEQDFRDFVFVNPVSLWAGTNRDFFKGTTIESEVDRLLAV